ncbi:MAG: transcriptional activator NhaR [Burkholderiales bacterium]
MAGLNYKHLHYFWVVAKSGGIARASERLHLTPQTISGQITLFEDLLGYKLFARVGRRLELTDAGRVALSYADEIFSLGEELADVLRQKPAGRPQQFRVGICDIVPKSMAFRLLEPALRMADPMHIHCREGKLAGLLADLAVHRLDIVLSDSPMPGNLNVHGFNHLLGESGFTFFASTALAKAHAGPFPRCLHGAPLLLQGEDTVMRTRFVQWLEKEAIKPRIIGDFDDTALLKAFGEAGVGIFAAPTVTEEEVCEKYHVKVMGRTDAVRQQFYVISVERRLSHPAVVAISNAAHDEIFRAGPKRRKSSQKLLARERQQ